MLKKHKKHGKEMAVQVLQRNYTEHLRSTSAVPGATQALYRLQGLARAAGSGPAPAHLLICGDLGSSALDLSSLN